MVLPHDLAAPPPPLEMEAAAVAEAEFLSPSSDWWDLPITIRENPKRKTTNWVNL